MIIELKNFKHHDEFIEIQYKCLEIAKLLNPEAIKFGFNINSTYQCEIYVEDDGKKDTAPAGDLNWKNFIDLFPEYVTFCKKYNFYLGCTIISNYINYPHRHGQGEHTLTYPLAHCDDIQVIMLTPKNIDELNLKNIHCISQNDEYDIDFIYETKTDIPFMLKADHFHTTSKKNFLPGMTMFTVWHHLNSFSNRELVKIREKYEL